MVNQGGQMTEVKFDASLVQGDGRTIVRMRGELDLATVAQARRVLLEAVGDGYEGDVEVNVSRLRFINASGLGLLADAASRAAQQGRLLCLSGPSAMLLRLVHITGLDQRLVVDRTGSR
jgi:anti-anti-sigma factor